MHMKEVVIFFRVTNTIFPTSPPPPVLNDCSLISVAADCCTHHILSDSQTVHAGGHSSKQGLGIYKI